ncbi:MAG: phosphoribosylformylglycinamidine synthase subunit PurS, partial [Methanobrevibacter sp.]|nr:phosphoribosylformylglycinamidine synthase subunit PurS [Methanobrevibacter sp.]
INLIIMNDRIADKFQMEGDDREAIRENVVDMCERLLCNPVIHDYKINVIPQNMACGK